MVTTNTSGTAVPAVVLEPDAQAVVDALAAAGGPPLYTLTPADARAVLDNAQSGEIAMAPAAIEHRMIPGSSGVDVSITIVRPVSASGVLPAVLYIHGGGWVLGNFGTHQRLVRDLVAQTGAVFVFVNYPPSPEAHYPVAIEQAYDTLTWMAGSGAGIGIDPDRIAVVGDSVGGNMAAALTILSKQRGGPGLCFQALLYPVTNAAFDTESYDQFAEGPWLTRKAMAWFWDAYAPDVAVRSEPTASPLLASGEELEGLPPALVITDEADVLRDEGEAYGRKLRQAGVDVTAVRYEGVFHDFMMLNGLAQTNGTRAAIAQTARALKSALGL